MPASSKRKPKSSSDSTVIRKTWPRIREIIVKGTRFYQVDSRRVVDGVNVGTREAFTTLQDARTRANKLEDDSLRASLDTQNFPEAMRVEAQQCADLLVPYSVPLIQVVREYVARRSAEEKLQSDRTFTALVDAFLEYKHQQVERNQLRATTLSELRTRCARYVQHFGNHRVGVITRQHIEQYLHSLNVSEQALKNERVKLGQVLSWAMERGWIATNPILGIKVHVPVKNVSVLTAAECTRLLYIMREEPHAPWLPFIVISMFAGLRPGEAKSLRWEHIHFGTKQIEVLADNSKTGRITGHRYVPIEPLLSQWLLLGTKREDGPVFQESKFNHLFHRARVLAGLVPKERGKGRGRRNNLAIWDDDILRHTFASMWLGREHNRARLAEIMGNTVEVIGQRYRRALPDAEIEAFWKLTPRAVARARVQPVTLD